MRVSQAIGGPRDDKGRRAAISGSLNRAPVAGIGRHLRLQQALAQVESLKRALASSQQAATAAQHLVEVLTKATETRRSEDAGREHEVSQGAQPDPKRKLIDSGLFSRTEPGTRLSGKRILPVPTRFHKGEVLFRLGDKFDALYAIRYGSCKTVLLAKGGHDQIAGFYMVGEIVGMDGIASELHECDAIALEDMEAFRLPFNEIESLARRSQEYGHDLHKLLSQECGRAYSVMLMLGTMCAEQRVAFFLLDLSQRYQSHGYSSSEYVLRMTRKEIGSYLGLKLETVSRILSQFQRAGMLQVEGRNVKLRDRAAVSQLIESV
jgi:CRP/FNR family transcriptional regulator, anaerobic regulatory protein